MWVLEVESDGTSEPVVFRLPLDGVKTIGRATGADFVIDGALMSRLHCRLSAGASAIDVTDLDSTNGTFVNGTRVKQATLRAGDSLMVGRLVFKVSRSY